MTKLKVKINDAFWSKYDALIRDEVIPYQRDALNDNVADANPSGLFATSASQLVRKKANSMAWFSRIVTWQSG